MYNHVDAVVIRDINKYQEIDTIHMFKAGAEPLHVHPGLQELANSIVIVAKY